MYRVRYFCRISYSESYVHGKHLEQVISLLPSATMHVHFIVEVFLSNGNILLVYSGQICVWCNNFKYLNFTELHCFFRNLYYWISILNPFTNIPTHKNRVLFRPFVKPAVRVKAKSIKLRTYILRSPQFMIHATL